MREFLLSLPQGSLYSGGMCFELGTQKIFKGRIVVNKSKFGLGFERQLFTEELLLEAAASLRDVSNFLSKAAIVARHLNAQLPQNQGKVSKDWELLFLSVFDGDG